MIYPSTPQHPVTPHNQDQPCNLHPLTKHAETAETHFGVYPITPCNINCDASLTESSISDVTLEGNESNAPTIGSCTDKVTAAPAATGNASELAEMLANDANTTWGWNDDIAVANELREMGGAS